MILPIESAVFVVFVSTIGENADKDPKSSMILLYLQMLRTKTKRGEYAKQTSKRQFGGW